MRLLRWNKYGRRSAMFAAVLSVLVLCQPTASAEAETYGAYSMAAQRSAGLFGDANGWRNQWAWSPRADGESRISWGNPEQWPPSKAERFLLRGDWVLLDGWSDNGTFYRQRVDRELIGDGPQCANQRPLPDSGGRQHYVRWNIPSRPYCLIAEGTITEESSGKSMRFRHTQRWFPPAPCANRHLGQQTCIVQHESWSDDRERRDGHLVRRLERDQYIARGIGMAFSHRAAISPSMAG